jgi:hypothetical protein
VEVAPQQARGEIEHAVGALHAPDVAHPEDVDVAPGGRLRPLHEHARDLARQLVVAGEHLLLRLGLRQDRARAPQAEFVQPAVAPVAHQEALRIAVGVARAAEHEALAVATAEHRQQADMHARAARVVELGIGALQRGPQSAPARVEEPEQRQARVRRVGLVHADAFPRLRFGLAVVPGHHAHVVAAARQRAGEQRLLHPFARNVVVAEFGCEDGEVFQAEEADSHAASLRQASRSGR